MLIKKPFVLIALFASLAALGQPDALLEKEIIFDGLPKEFGLSQRTINCILQDDDGLIWLGTWSGLVRYDGYSTKLYNASDKPGSLKSNKITRLAKDKNGTLWIGTRMGGLFRYDKISDKFEQYVQSEGNNGLSNNNIWALLPDEDNTLWIGTENGLNKLDVNTGKFTSYFANAQSNESLIHNFITSIYKDKKGRMWIATEVGLHRMHHNGDQVLFERFIYKEDSGNKNLHNYIYQVLEHNNAIWICTKLGLKKLKNGEWSNFILEEKAPSFSFFRTMHLLPMKTPLILAGSEMGLNFFDINKESFVRFMGNYDPKINLTDNVVMSIFLDDSEILWIGTRKGLNKFDTYDNGFQLYKTSRFDTSQSIISGIAAKGDDNYWISTLGGGLYKFKWNGDNPKFTRYKIKTNEPVEFTDFIQTMRMDSKGQLWIGTAGSGLYTFSTRQTSDKNPIVTKFKNFSISDTLPNQLSDNYIMSITEGSQEVIWIGTWSGGLNRIKNNEVTQYPDPILSEVPLVALLEDALGVLWVGTRGMGLIRVDIDQNNQITLKRYRHNENDEASISNDFINAIIQDSNGDLWIGSEGGLDFFDRHTGTFTQFPIHATGKQEVVVGILEDSESRLWISHWNGLSVVKPLDPSFEVRHFDRSDRIQGGFFYNNVCFSDHGSNLFFGGADGLNIVKPHIIKNPFKPKVMLKDFRVFNDPIRVDSAYQGNIILNQDLNNTEEIFLKFDQNSISFELVALHYAAPKKNVFSYKLEGFEQEWQYSNSAQRYINYTNLPDGQYIFRAMASKNDGTWGPERKLVIVVAPPWWRTLWAMLIYIFAFMVILYAFKRLILARADFVNNLKLERLEKQNLEKLNKAKLEFFTNVSHEFRTPLTLIAGPLQKILDSGNTNRFLREQLLIINQNTQRLLRLVGQLLDFRKADAGNLKLRVAEGNIVKFLEEIQLSFSGLADQKQVNVGFVSSSNVIKVWYDRDQLEKVFFNLLSNAFKYTPPKGNISVSIFENANDIKISVEDSGSGIRPENFEKIFERFFSQDSDHQSTGIGLALSKSIIDLHHGSIEVESLEEKFTRFLVTLKLGKEHFDTSEIIHDFKDSEVIELYPDLSALKLEPEDGSKEYAYKNLESWPRILIVEDNSEIRDYVKSIFRGKYVTLEAENGQAGYDMALEEMPDLIISDIMMPGIDGIVFCKMIKENIKTSHIPVILLTARTSLIFKVEGLESGADDYVTKPFDPKVLELKVRNIIRSREALRKEFKDNEVLKVEPKRITLTNRDEEFISRALESVEENMSNSEYGVEDLGKDTGMSRMQLYRKLKALTGQSANEFIRTIRLKRAAQLIEHDELTIAEVTYEVGFSDLPYFRSCFKKQFGVNPSAYAKKDGSAEDHHGL
ncbi:two-component regulator propeller domain-containing protein [Fulvivirga sp. M361]|uniref:hybrid sensor histidine kinase/response regulator transcription factor n=1 Tax=Fulvivirga sp. M361 TaxID=2594266 RepID=UPI00117AD0C7|nr:two-component regulator propeller domain-containing protein [Fulvivirga sp. M361]